MFRFKQFTIQQERCAMKVGTDGVLLGAWSPLPQQGCLLDIGTGTGLIAIMCAQRKPQLQVDAIEIDDDASQQAAENANNSPFKERIHIINQSLQTFAQSTSQHYDAIVCNPPYFINSLKAPKQQRSLARHTDSLPFEVLISCAKQLMHPLASFSVILPLQEAILFQTLAEQEGMHMQRLMHLYPTPQSTEKRRMLSFVLYPCSCLEEELTIELERHQYTEAYKELTKDFYLNH